MKRYLNFNKGFSFLEVLASLVILSVALIPIINWLPTAIETKLRSERKTTAIFLCQSKIEDLRYQTINDFNDESDVGSSFNAPYQDFSYTVTYEPVSSDLKTITVRVRHKEKPQDETVLFIQIARR